MTRTETSSSHHLNSPAPSATVVAVATPSPATPPPATPQEARRQAVAAIVSVLPEVIKAQIAKAKEGSYQHAKFLCDFADLSSPLEAPGAAEEESLAHLLLQKLQIGNDESEAEAGEPSSVL